MSEVPGNSFRTGRDHEIVDFLNFREKDKSVQSSKDLENGIILRRNSEEHCHQPGGSAVHHRFQFSDKSSVHVVELWEESGIAGGQLQAQDIYLCREQLLKAKTTPCRPTPTTELRKETG